MDMYEFGRRCKPLNKQYLELFGTIPCIQEYACSREEFLTALETAVETKQEIGYLLPGILEE